jgi:hypothetical protein
MITTDLTSHRSPSVQLTERETHGLHTGHPSVVDTAELLDHHTRAQTVTAADAPPGRYLAFEDGGAGRLLALRRPITHVGRGLTADLRLEDPHVSRRHAIVALRGEGVRVLDDRSANGTFVNGRPVDIAELSDGDVLRVGRAVFRYVEIQRAPRGRSRGRGDRALRRGWVGTGSTPVRRGGAVLRPVTMTRSSAAGWS